MYYMFTQHYHILWDVSQAKPLKKPDLAAERDIQPQPFCARLKKILLYLLHTEEEKPAVCWQSEDISAGPRDFKEAFEGKDLVLRFW